LWQQLHIISAATSTVHTGKSAESTSVMKNGAFWEVMPCHNIPDDTILHSYRREKLKSYNFCYVCSGRGDTDMLVTVIYIRDPQLHIHWLARHAWFSEACHITCVILVASRAISSFSTILARGTQRFLALWCRHRFMSNAVQYSRV
jgi:hypothetical protein